MSFSLGEYHDIFLEESDELLQSLNKNLLDLEKNPDDENIINNIFRVVHSLKSSAAFVGLNNLSDLAHKIENLLQGIRDKSNLVTPEVFDIIFKCFDMIDDIIKMVSLGNEPVNDFKPLIEELNRVNESSRVKDNTPVAKVKKNASVEFKKTKTVFTRKENDFIKKAIAGGLDCLDITVFIEKNAQKKWGKAQVITVKLGEYGDVVKVSPSLEEMTLDDSILEFKVILLTQNDVFDVYKVCNVDQVDSVVIRRISIIQKNGQQLLKRSSALDVAVNELYGETEKQVNDVHWSDSGSPIDGWNDDSSLNYDYADRYRIKNPILKTVKVSVDKLDLLLNNVDDIILGNSEFYRLYDEICKHTENKAIVSEFKNRMDQMSKIAKDLQTAIMQTRMVPIGNVFSRFNRLVRDLANEQNKNVELVIKGEDTEIDKKIIDAIGEPLMHLIRNAIDHGIESVSERALQGKSDVATVNLNAYQCGNQIFVEISDDGKGLDIEEIKDEIEIKGLATLENLSNMEDEDIYKFIFIPGFSTSEVISDISGRGVGMNVVKEVVEDLNGSVSIETEMGMGTKFILSFPLTLALMSAFMVKVEGEEYAIPISNVIETTQISPDDIVVVDGHDSFVFKGEDLSLLRLKEFVGLNGSYDYDKKMPVVIVGNGNRKIGLIVDLFDGNVEIIVKSLDQNYTSVEGFVGASILGNGRVCLVLDIYNMIDRVNLQQKKICREEQGDVINSHIDNSDKSEEIKVSESGNIFEAENLESQPVEDSVKVDCISGENFSGENNEIQKQAQNIFDEFKDELALNISSTVLGGFSDSHIENELNITKDEISEFNLISNMGVAIAAESLSRLLNKRIDLSVPELKIVAVENIPAFFEDLDDTYMGVMLGIEGEIKGALLFIVKEDVGSHLIDMLYETISPDEKGLGEDGISALKELTNIIGSSILNVYAEKSNIVLKPNVPTFVCDHFYSIIDSIFVMHSVDHDYAILMDTGFYLEDHQVLGNLMILPEAESLKKLVKGIKDSKI